jgi:hypothetical protein
MNRLFALEFSRLRRQTSTWVIGLIILALGGFNVLISSVFSFPDENGTRIFIFTTRSILESSFQLGQIQILLIGVIASLFIASDISQGTIRNKIIAGHSKFEIYLVQMGMSIAITVIGLMLFHALPTAFSWLITFPITVDDGGSFANFLIHMSFGYFLVITGVLVTTWVALRTKTTASAIIFTLLIFVLGPSFSTIVLSIIQGIALANTDQFLDAAEFVKIQAQVVEIFEWVYFYQLNRLANVGSLFDFNGITNLNFFNANTLPFILKTLISNAILLTLIIGLGGRRFAKSDLR